MRGVGVPLYPRRAFHIGGFKKSGRAAGVAGTVGYWLGLLLGFLLGPFGLDGLPCFAGRRGGLLRKFGGWQPLKQPDYAGEMVIRYWRIVLEPPRYQHDAGIVVELDEVRLDKLGPRRGVSLGRPLQVRASVAIG